MSKELLSILLRADGLSFWTGDTAEGYGTGGMSISRAGSERLEISYPIPAEGSTVGESIGQAVSEVKGILASRKEGVPADKIVYVDTLSTVLVPAPVFRDEHAAGYPAMHAMAVPEGTFVVCSRPIHGTVAVMVAGKSYMEHLGEALGDFAVASPLQYNLCLGGGAQRQQPANGNKRKPVGRIGIFTTPSNAYINVFSEDGNGLVYAEALPMSSGADLTYYLDWIAGRYRSGSWPVVVRGYRAEELARMSSRHFKGCICG